MNNIGELDIIILLGVRDGRTIVEIATNTGKSQATIQKKRRHLMAIKLVDQKVGPNGGGLHRGHFLTDLGKRFLKESGHVTEQRS